MEERMRFLTDFRQVNGRRPANGIIAFVVSGSLILSGCVSTSGKVAVADLLTPDQESIDAVKKKPPGAYEQTLANAADPSPEYRQAAANMPQRPGMGEPPPGASLPNAVMQANGINASRASIFGNSATPSPVSAAGFNATNTSVFSSSGKNPLLQGASNSGSATDDPNVTAYMEEDDVPLILRGRLYSSSDLGPDPNDQATDMVTLASLPSMTRQSATDLLIQRADVDTSCFKPELVSMLHDAEKHFGKRIVVTSGYRDPVHNARVGGAKHSQHLHCNAADIQMVGVSKWDLARYFRSRPDMGGVGTYCSTNSIHVDIGPRRDWNWKCRRDTLL